MKFCRTILSYLTPVAILALLALVNSPATVAQQTAQPQEQSSVGAAEQQASDQQGQAETPEQPQDGTQDTNGASAQADAGTPRGGRFIPSEQISQDLGVSFPVDI